MENSTQKDAMLGQEVASYIDLLLAGNAEQIELFYARNAVPDAGYEGHYSAYTLTQAIKEKLERSPSLYAHRFYSYFSCVSNRRQLIIMTNVIIKNNNSLISTLIDILIYVLPPPKSEMAVADNGFYFLHQACSLMCCMYAQVVDYDLFRPKVAKFNQQLEKFSPTVQQLYQQLYKEAFDVYFLLGETDIATLIAQCKGKQGRIWDNYYGFMVNNLYRQLSSPTVSPAMLDNLYERLYFCLQQQAGASTEVTAEEIARHAQSPLFRKQAALVAELSYQEFPPYRAAIEQIEPLLEDFVKSGLLSPDNSKRIWNLLPSLMDRPEVEMLGVEHYTNWIMDILGGQTLRLHETKGMNDPREGKVIGQLMPSLSTPVRTKMPLLASLSFRRRDWNQYRLYASQAGENTNISGGSIQFHPRFLLDRLHFCSILYKKEYIQAYHCLYVDADLAEMGHSVVHLANHTEYDYLKCIKYFFYSIEQDISKIDVDVNELVNPTVEQALPEVFSIVESLNSEMQIPALKSTFLQIYKKLQAGNINVDKILSELLRELGFVETVLSGVKKKFTRRFERVKTAFAALQAEAGHHPAVSLTAVEQELQVLLSYLVKDARFKDEEELRLVAFKDEKSLSKNNKDRYYHDYAMDYRDFVQVNLGEHFSKRQKIENLNREGKLHVRISRLE